VHVTPGLAQDMGMTGFKHHLTRPELLAGPSTASIKYSYLLPSDTQVNTFGFAVGLGTSYVINNRFKIVVKIIFERKGGRRNGDLETFDSTTQTRHIYKGAAYEIDRLNYLTIPIILDYSFGRKVPFHIGIGPYLSRLLKAQSSFGNSILNQKFVVTLTDNYRKIDFGVTVSIGFEISLKKGYKVEISLVGTSGLINITPAYGLTEKTNALCFMISLPVPKIF